MTEEFLTDVFQMKIKRHLMLKFLDSLQMLLLAIKSSSVPSVKYSSIDYPDTELDIYQAEFVVLS